MIGLDPDAEARELRALVALLEKERSELVGQLDEYEDELNRERHHSLALDDELSRLRNKEMLISSPIVNIDENEVELLRQKVDEAGVVIKDLEARLALAEEGEQHLMNVMDENERAHSSKLSALASKLATLEMENNRLRSENELMSPRDQSTALLEAKAAEAERARKTVEDDLLHLQAELAELKMQTELDAGDSPSARPLDPFGTLSDRRAHDPEIHGALEEFDVDQLLPLKEQYRSRIRHFTALEKDVDRVLHVRDPVKYPHPDKKAEKPAEPEKTDNDEDEGDYLDAQWLELAHWMRGRFGQRTSLKELKRYISRFTPKKLRAPTGDDASYDSPRSTDGRQGKWRQDACSQGESTLSYLSERELFERVLSEARRKGRSLYMSDRSQHSTSSPSI
eukprot:TRINITY_DN33552_c0_g1_i1.p1 TRINITY_DN33552_c0_g1~~TRINITY_DN33552_c0_g1_i1.p1  ORF type:complete len:408 (+),score=109.83 TRINITY_DN33552_c0_g1_i1:37-1224(+)